MQNEPPFSLEEAFSKPPVWAYPAVYWFWHHIPDPRQIVQQLEEIHHAGYRTFLIQPRLAFPLEEYLNLEYLEAYRYAMRVAKEFGLTAGIYDDYNWISGHAGGQTVADREHLRERHLFWSRAILRSGKAVCTISGIHNNLGDGLGEAFNDWVYQGGQPRWGDWQVYRVYALTPGVAPLDVSARSRVLQPEENGCQVEVHLNTDLPPETEVIAFINARCLTSRLVNYLHPETAERFIQVGYEPYRQAVGDYFGDPLSFLFIDQPYAGFYTWNEHFGNPLNSLMFDESLEQAYQQTHGEELGFALLSLLLPGNDENARSRCNFYEMYGELARRRFLKPISDWARQNGLLFTGHELLGFVGEWGFADGLPALDSRVNFGADYFAVDAYKDISAVDACNYHPQVSARFGASLSQVQSRRGCIIEQYSVPVGRTLPAPAGQWDLTLGCLRSQAIRHLLFGANQFLFHAYYQANESDAAATPLRSPRFDFPPGINYEPWFRFHPAFAEELARLNVFLSSGQPQAQTALLYPLRTCWHGGPEHPFNAESRFWNRWLSERGIQYDIIGEEQVSGSALYALGYRLLILPGAEVVPGAQFATELAAFADAGGQIIASGPLPSITQADGQNAALREQIQALLHHPGVVHYAIGDEAGRGEALRNMNTAIPALFDVEWEEDENTPCWMWQGAQPGERLLALFNDSHQERLANIRTDNDWLPYLYDPAGGDSSCWNWYTHTGTTAGTHTQITLPMQPHSMVCLRLTARKTDPDEAHILRIEGNVRLHSARHEPEGSLTVELDAHAAGLADLLLYCGQEPQVEAGQCTQRVSPAGENLWQIHLNIPSIPQPRPLDKEWTLQIPGEFRPRSINPKQGWEYLHPHYAGVGYYRCRFPMQADDLDYVWALRFPAVHTALSAYLNQNWLGARGWQPYTFALPGGALKVAYNLLETAVWNTAGNACYHKTPYECRQPHPAGLLDIPYLTPFIRVKILVAR